MADSVHAVAIGQMVISDAPGDVLVAYGLGSCVAICLYDPVAQVGGMLHALLPTAPSRNGAGSNPAKFVDLGTPRLLAAVLKKGARRSRLITKLCGGGQVLSTPGFNSQLNIGERNVVAAEAALQAAGLRIKAQSTGGRAGRTVKLYIADGKINVKTLGQGEQVLR